MIDAIVCQIRSNSLVVSLKAYKNISDHGQFVVDLCKNYKIFELFCHEKFLELFLIPKEILINLTATKKYKAVDNRFGQQQ